MKDVRGSMIHLLGLFARILVIIRLIQLDNRELIGFLCVTKLLFLMTSIT